MQHPGWDARGHDETSAGATALWAAICMVCQAHWLREVLRDLRSHSALTIPGTCALALSSGTPRICSSLFVIVGSGIKLAPFRD